MGVLELSQGFIEVAGQTRGVEAEDGQRAALLAHRFDDDERGMRLGMFRGDAVRVLIEAEADQIMLERGNTVEPPRGVGEGLDELFFDDVDGFVAVEERAGEVLVSGEVLGWQDDGLAGQAVTVGVERRFAFCRLRFSGRLNGPRWRDCARCGLRRDR